MENTISELQLNLQEEEIVFLLIGAEMGAVVDVELALDRRAVPLPHADLGGGQHRLRAQDRVRQIKDRSSTSNPVKDLGGRVIV